MLENASQSIACDFDTLQGISNVPSWVCSITVCGWAFIIAISYGENSPIETTDKSLGIERAEKGN